MMVIGGAHAQESGSFAPPAARIARVGVNQSLAATSADASEAAVRGCLRAARHSKATVPSLVVAGSNVGERTGVTHLRFMRRVSGLEIYGVYVRASVRAGGQLASVIENNVPSMFLPAQCVALP